MRDLGSATLQKVTGSGTCSRGEALGLLGRLLRSFHQLPYPPPGPGAPLAVLDFAAQVTALRQHLPDELRTATQASLEQAIDLFQTRPPVWCHGDLHSDNVLLCGQEGDRVPHLIDFEQSTIAAAEYDLAQTVVTSDAFGHDDQAQLLAAYGTGLSEDLLASLITFHTLRGWRWAALHENRDIALWQARLRLVLDQYAGATQPRPDTKGHS
ncbi:aminoglycoside phosphotransferase family protein [Streptosporangium sp. NPDC005286]|uniref:aminoglycoside phosphotransferase family protein n=1 Tax=Streptosporangium sp. NPDC005286 TaxID=3154463 RepID=UPI0033A338B5